MPDLYNKLGQHGDPPAVPERERTPSPPGPRAMSGRRGFVYAIGIGGPDVTVQFKPLLWQFSASWSRGQFALGIGPLAVRVHWALGRVFERSHGTFVDGLGGRNNVKNHYTELWEDAP